MQDKDHIFLAAWLRKEIHDASIEQLRKEWHLVYGWILFTLILGSKKFNNSYSQPSPDNRLVSIPDWVQGWDYQKIAQENFNAIQKLIAKKLKERGIE